MMLPALLPMPADVHFLSAGGAMRAGSNVESAGGETFSDALAGWDAADASERTPIDVRATTAENPSGTDRSDAPREAQEEPEAAQVLPDAKADDAVDADEEVEVKDGEDETIDESEVGGEHGRETASVVGHEHLDVGPRAPEGPAPTENREERRAARGSEAPRATFAQVNPHKESSSAANRSGDGRTVAHQSSSTVTPNLGATANSGDPQPVEERTAERPVVAVEGRSPIPAAARAEQVENAIRLEQVTGQQANMESGRAQSASGANQMMVDGAVRIAPALDGQSGAPQLMQSMGSAADTARLEESPMTSRIVRGLSAMINQRGGSLSMRLDPPDLGSLRIQMTIARGSVSAHIYASTAQAHGLLENSLATLRAALESHGLTVERLSVHMHPSTNQSAQQHGQDGSTRDGQDGHQHADAGEGQSRGRRDGDRAAGQSSEARAPDGFGEFMERIEESARSHS